MKKSEAFWSWFVENEKSYTFLASLEPSVNEELLDNFLTRLHEYCDELYFEIGGLPDQDQELIITAEGNKDYFPAVEELIRDAPSIPGWVFIAFKQPTDGHFKSEWGDIELDTQEIWFDPLNSKTSTGIGIRVYVPNFDLIKENESTNPLLLKMIDTIIGEKAFASDLEYIEFASQIADPEEGGQISIIELSDYIGWRKKRP
jgi:hypothetical protein